MPRISEEALISFLPSVAWTLLCATNTGIPEWVHEDWGYRIAELHKLLAKRDQRAVDWMTELARKSGENGKPWLSLIEALEDESA